MKTGSEKVLRVAIDYRTKNIHGGGGGGYIPMFFADVNATDEQIRESFFKEYPLRSEYEEKCIEFNIKERAVVERLKYHHILPITCPRRDEGFGYGEELKDHVRENGTCSFCGSIMPELFWELIEAGAPP